MNENICVIGEQHWIPEPIHVENHISFASLENKFAAKNIEGYGTWAVKSFHYTVELPMFL